MQLTRAVGAACLIGLIAVVPPSVAMDRVGSQVEASPPDPAPSIEAVIAAVEAYEEQLPSLAWQQSVSQFATDPKSGIPPDRYTMDVAVARDSRWYMAISGCINETLYYAGAGVGGGVVFGKVPVEGRKVGYVRAPQMEYHGGLVSPWMLLTDAPERLFASPTMLRVTDALRRLEETEVDASGTPLIVIRGSRSARNGDEWEDLEYVFDSSKGYMPVRMTRRDEETRAITHEVATTASVEVAGVWIPSEGRRLIGFMRHTENWERLSADAQSSLIASLNERVSRAGLDLATRAGRRARFDIKRALLKGPMKEVQVDLVDRGQQLRAWNFRVLDDALAAELFKPPFDEGDKVLDRRTGSTCYWRGGKLVKEDGTPVVFDATAAKAAAAEQKPSPSPQQVPEATPRPKPPAENAKP